MKRLIAIAIAGILIFTSCTSRAHINDTPVQPAPPPPPTAEPASETHWPELELSITVLHGDSALPAGKLHEVDYVHASAHGERIMIQTNVPLHDFALVTFYIGMDEYELWYVPQATYGAVAQLLPGDAFIIVGYIGMGTLPHSGVTFIDQYGQRRYFAMQRDQSLGLRPSPHMPGFLEAAIDGRVRIDATTGGGGAWDLGYFEVDADNFDPDAWLIQNRYRWAAHEMMIWELHDIRDS